MGRRAADPNAHHRPEQGALRAGHIHRNAINPGDEGGNSANRLLGEGPI